MLGARRLKWLLRGLAFVVVAVLLAWGALVYVYRDAGGPGVPLWGVARFIAEEVGARVYCAVTGCPAELPEGMTIQEWAAPEWVPSTPVALEVDPWHRVYVAEADRNQGGTEDNRRHMYWLEDDLASTTVEDRRSYYEKWVASGKIEDPELFTKRADRLYVLEDRDGDGRADHSRDLAHWNDWVDGLLAGVLWHEGNLYATGIPSLYRLKNVAESDPPEIETLATGFGVKTSLIGHDLHGLVWGPDGRIYFSLGDRGYNVVTREGRRLTPTMDPGRGAVFRMNPDGSELEAFAEGLRNPQELAFDDYGNLFTGDNNGDGGDAARIVYVVEGGDSGWAMPVQTLVGDYVRGPWNAEKLWELQHPTQPAWILPPIAHLSVGPAGLAAYPGLGLPERYAGRFFLCDYRYQPSRSEIWSFGVEPEGAGFRMVDAETFVGSILVTDVVFGWDGRIYSARYNDIQKTQSLVVMEHAEARSDPRVAETVALAREGMGGRPVPELVTLLGHADRRIRQRAQQELVRRGDPTPLGRVARNREASLIPRLHALWGLGQLGPDALHALRWEGFAWAASEEPELRAQLAKLAGEVEAERLAPELLAWLGDPNPRVRFFAAQSLGHIRSREAVEPLVALLRGNADQDVFLRHAASLALFRIGDLEAVRAHADDESRAVRMGVLLVLRRAGDPRIARFLDDPDPALVLEAARAIHDLPISEAMPALAALPRERLPHDDDPQTSFALHRRVIDANRLLGTEAAAVALAAHVADEALPEAMRRLALDALAEFAKPAPREYVWGSWRPRPERDPAVVHAALDRYGRTLVEGSLGDRALEVAVSYGRVPLDDDELLARVRNGSLSEEMRAASLRALARRDGAAPLDAAIQTALASDVALLRAEARDALVEARPTEALVALAPARFEGEMLERQRAFAALARLEAAEAEALLADAFDRLDAGTLPADTQLDLIEAARATAAPALLERIAAFERRTPASDRVGARAWALEGGAPARGRLVFQGHGDCQRCHGEAGHGAGAGPPLDGVGSARDRTYLLRAVVEPSADIAEGWATYSVTRHDGSVVTGQLVSEDEETLVLETGGQQERVALAEIARRIGPVSAMPPNGLALGPRDLRDLVAYLASL
jgi:quinoprotein glucose dehydrogenase